MPTTTATTPATSAVWMLVERLAMIFHAMEATGTTDARRVLVAGDTSRDVQAGRNAGGAFVIAVRTGEVTTENLAAAGPTHVLDSVADIPNCWLISASRGANAIPR